MHPIHCFAFAFTVAAGKGLLAAIMLAATAAFGTVLAVKSPQPLVPSTSPDQDTVCGQAENLRTQFETLGGTTDVITGGGGSFSSVAPAGSAPPISGKSFIITAGVNATTLAAPVAGAPSAGGNDGLTIEIISQTANAHTVTTPANKINGNKHIATFPATIGVKIQLTAQNGTWWSDGGGTTLS